MKALMLVVGLQVGAIFWVHAQWAFVFLSTYIALIFFMWACFYNGAPHKLPWWLQ